MISRVCELIEDIFSPVIFTLMVLSALNICVSFFEVREVRTYIFFMNTIYYVTGVCNEARVAVEV